MKYDFKLEIENEDNSLSKLLARIKPHSRILEFGCANGRMTQYMHTKLSCEVTIVEIDHEAGEAAAQYASKALLGEVEGDIETFVWCKKLTKGFYDYIIFADVLEHIKNPEQVLKRAKDFLASGGSILVSLPNIANNAIIANLINDEFIYTDLGLLDSTHISFFTKKTFERLIKKIGMYLYYESATTGNIGHNEVAVSYDEISPELNKILMGREYGIVYQNIFEFGNEYKGEVLTEYREDPFPYFCSTVLTRYANEDDLDLENTYLYHTNLHGHLHLKKKYNKPVNLIRFDPMETNGIVYIKSIYLNNKKINLEECPSNAFDRDQNYFYFLDLDPYIYIEIEDSQMIDLEIEYEIEEFELNKSEFKKKLQEHIYRQKQKIDNQNGTLQIQTKELDENKYEISKLNTQLNTQKMTLEHYIKLSLENADQIKALNEQVVIANKRLESIKKRSTIFWRVLDKYNPLRFSRDIDYFIDSVNVSFNKMVIKGWVVSAAGKPVKIKGRPTLKVTHMPRIDVNRVKELSDDYMSGFEIKAVPFLPLQLKFLVGTEKNVYKVNGTKLYGKYFCELYKKLKKSLKKRGLRRTFMLMWYMMIGKKHLYADSYDQWFALHKTSPEELQEQRNTVFSYRPLISIVIPTFNTPVRFLEDVINSIEDQTYTNWEVCIADGHSTNKKTIEALQKIEKKYKNVHIKYLSENYMISGNTNEALKLVQGEFVCLMDHDDLIEPNALFEFVRLLNDDPELDFIYSDEDKISDDGRHYMIPHFKPDFAIDNLRSFNYITHFVCIRKSILDKAGPFDSKCDGAQDYDMFLRIVDITNKIGHVTKILYHWRVAKKSTARDTSNKSYVTDAGKYALQKHLERNHLTGSVRDGLEPTIYKIDYEIINNPKISIIIATKDHIDDLDKCIRSVIEKSTYKNYEIIVVENNSEEERTFEYYKTSEAYSNIRVVYWEHEFNYSAINNFGVTFATGDYVLLLNNDTEVITPNWLEEMLMYAQREDVGAVGAKLFYPDDTIQHAGVIVGLGGVAAHSHRLYPGDNVGYVGRLIVAQDLSAVTAACLLVKRRIFEEVGGLSVKYRVAFNDVDFCLKIREKGYLNVMTPFAQLYHYESKSRGLEDTFEKQQRFLGEQLMFKEDWNDILAHGDPFYNPNLTLSAEDFSLKEL